MSTKAEDDLLRRMEAEMLAQEAAPVLNRAYVLVSPIVMQSWITAVREARERIAQTANDAARAHSGRSLRDSVEAYRMELLESNPPVAHVLGMLLEGCE